MLNILCSNIKHTLSLLFLDMVQFEQYDATPSVSVEPDANVEVNFLLLLLPSTCEYA